MIIATWYNIFSAWFLDIRISTSFMVSDISDTRCKVVLGGIIFLLPVYGITNSERYSVFHGI